MTKEEKEKADEKRKVDAKKKYTELDEEAQRAARQRDGSSGWPTQVGIHRVAWNNGSGYSCASLLASGMACGFVRIDWLEGRFFHGKAPYGDIASLRGEELGLGDDVKMDLDVEDD